MLIISISLQTTLRSIISMYTSSIDGVSKIVDKAIQFSRAECPELYNKEVLLALRRSEVEDFLHSVKLQAAFGADTQCSCSSHIPSSCDIYTATSERVQSPYARLSISFTFLIYIRLNT
jgi:hypothetical protein